MKNEEMKKMTNEQMRKWRMVNSNEEHVFFAQILRPDLR